MLESRSEIFAWILAGLVVVAMGVIVFTGPFHKVNKSKPTSAASAAGGQTVRILNDPTAQGKYLPKTVTVHVGDSITFTNVSGAIHTVTAENNSFDSRDIDTNGAAWKFSPTKDGTFKYYCIYHPLMKGTLVVKG